MPDFHELKVWNKAMDLTVETYRITKMLPKEELYAMTSQIRRAAVSIPSNIAEGASRKSDRDFCHFLKIACGSLSELETQLILCVRLGYVQQTDLLTANGLLSETGRMLSAMIHKLTANS